MLLIYDRWEELLLRWYWTTPPYGCSSSKGLIFAKWAILLLRYNPFLFFYSYLTQYLQVFKYVLFGRADYDWFLTPNSSLMVNKSCIHTQIFSLFINDEIMYSHANLFIIHQWCKGMKISFHISLLSTSWGFIQIPIRSFSLTVLEPLHPPSGCPLPARYSIETHIKTVKRS